jgi:hypothetical protein
VVLMDDDTPPKPKVILTAPAWAPPPQTAPAGEFVAAGLAYQAATSPAPPRIVTDCEAVHRAHRDYPAMPRKAVHAGVVRDSATYPNSKHVGHIAHMRAHQNAEAVAAEERRHAHGNAAADAAAKDAVARLHDEQGDGVAAAAAVRCARGGAHCFALARRRPLLPRVPARRRRHVRRFRARQRVLVLKVAARGQPI